MLAAPSVNPYLLSKMFLDSLKLSVTTDVLVCIVLTQPNG